MSMFAKGAGRIPAASWPAFLVGAGVVIVLPKLVRPLAKAGVRGFMDARDKFSEWAHAANESWREAAAEVAAESTPATPQGGGAAAATVSREGGLRGAMHSVMRELMVLRKNVASTANEVKTEWSDLVAEVNAERHRAEPSAEANAPEVNATEAEEETEAAAATPRTRSGRKSTRKRGSSRKA